MYVPFPCRARFPGAEKKKKEKEKEKEKAHIRITMDS